MATRRLSGTLTALFVALTIIAMLAAACGGDDAYGNSSIKAASTTAAPTSAAQPQPTTSEIVTVRDSSLGKILSDSAGMTLYTFKNDAAGSGKSACTSACATAWPPLTTTAATIPAPTGVTGALATIARDDGTKQVTYQGQPLYRYAADKSPGDTNGDGVGGVWSAVKLQPSGAAAGGGTPVAADGYNY